MKYIFVDYAFINYSSIFMKIYINSKCPWKGPDSTWKSFQHSPGGKFCNASNAQYTYPVPGLATGHWSQRGDRIFWQQILNIWKQSAVQRRVMLAETITRQKLQSSSNSWVWLRQMVSRALLTFRGTRWAATVELKTLTLLTVLLSIVGEDCSTKKRWCWARLRPQ